MQVPEKKKKMIEVQIIVKNVALCFFSHIHSTNLQIDKVM